MSFETLLIANRGEIALAIIEACRELRIRSVAVHSEADADMPYLRLADGSVCIGPAAPAKSYLNIAAIISAAELTGADAIHPGYGFLAESPDFVEVCDGHGIAFIGPPREAMELVGDKARTRETVAAAGVPVLPGALAPEDPDSLRSEADRIGYPLMIKAVYGGGGRGEGGEGRVRGRLPLPREGGRHPAAYRGSDPRRRGREDRPSRRAGMLGPAAPSKIDRGGARTVHR